MDEVLIQNNQIVPDPADQGYYGEEEVQQRHHLQFADVMGENLVEIHYSDRLHYSNNEANNSEFDPIVKPTKCCIIF